ncbi:MAG TPA: methyltransferase domain-containing protein [Caulobacteraceae bacterium]
MSGPPRIFDRRVHRLRRERAAPSTRAADFLHRRVSHDIVERLESVNRQFPVAVDIGAGHGAFAEALATSEAASKIGVLIEADLSARMLSGRLGPRVVADEERPPFAAGAVDLAVSGLVLHWVNDLVGALIQIRRAMRADGLFIGALLGGATLTELRQALLEAEAELCGGAGPRVSPFTDAFGAAGLLQRAGFALPVVDTDRLTVRYSHPLELIADLRAMGETSALVDRPQRRLSARVLARACEIYVARYTEADARVVATFEIITLTGWAPHPDQPKPLKPGSAKARLADALRGGV